MARAEVDVVVEEEEAAAAVVDTILTGSKEFLQQLNYGKSLYCSLWAWVS